LSARIAVFLVLSAAAGGTACTAAPSTGDDPTEDTTQALQAAPPAIARGRESVAFARAAIPADIPFPAGLAGDETLVFVGSPLDARVVALSRSGGTEIANLPPPPQGFVIPFIVHSIGPHRLAVLDAGGVPSPKPIIPANPTIYEYGYSFAGGVFRATLERAISFASVTVGFAEDFARLPDGGYLVSDALFGAIWRVDRAGAVHPGIVPRTLDPGDAIPELADCATMPEIQVGGVPFLFTGSSIPGVASFGVRDGVVYFNSACAGAVFRFPLASLFDRRAPWQRAADFRLVSRKPAGVQVEELLDMTFNPFDPEDPNLYAADALELRIIRIDPRSGRRAVVADGPRLFDFPSSLAFVPPRVPGGPAPLLVLSNEQERTPLLNDAITADESVLPYLLTEVVDP
jgi:hypothetical protein